MRKIICVLGLLIFVFNFSSSHKCFAAHDDSTLDRGGAWRPDNVNVGPGPSGSDTIDENLNKSFKKEPHCDSAFRS